MKRYAKHLSTRGPCGSIYYRRRIPTAILRAYPPTQKEIVICLGTSDRGVAEKLEKVEALRIDAEFIRMAESLKKQQAERAVKRLDKLTEEQLKALADYWVRQVLLADERRRIQGIEDDEFDELGSQLEQQRAELGRMLATGRSDKILPALHGFIYLCGLDVDLSPEESKRAGFVFLRAVVTGLDHQLQRQRGEVVQTDKVAPSVPTPKEAAAAKSEADAQAKTWDEAFAIWRDYVPGRPKSTAIATQTAYLELKRLAAEDGITAPTGVTPELMRKFVDQMAKRGLEVVTLNERLAKIKSMFKVLKGKGVLASNPAADTLGLKENSFKKRKNKRQPFDNNDLTNIFSSCVFNEQQLRSQGQSAEATYWIPIMMYYTGARTEELAGLALADVVHDSQFGWYLNLIDRPSPDDDLFDDDDDEEEDKPKPKSTSKSPKGADEAEAQWRLLKNGKSIRKVPVAQELIDLGLLRFLDSVRAEGHLSLFPSLAHDWHDKLSGAFSKFFGRYKKQILGIDNPKKVLYSFRHTMKDAMTSANVSSKYLKRVLGHASGEGAVTDGYGIQDVPLNVLTEEFKKITFFPIPAQAWMPGKGFVKYPKPDKTTKE